MDELEILIYDFDKLIYIVNVKDLENVSITIITTNT